MTEQNVILYIQRLLPRLGNIAKDAFKGLFRVTGVQVASNSPRFASGSVQKGHREMESIEIGHSFMLCQQCTTTWIKDLIVSCCFQN